MNYEGLYNQHLYHPNDFHYSRAVIALSAAAVQAEFALEPGLVTLVKFSSGNKPPVKGIIDVPMKLKDLIKEMRQQG